VADFTDGIKCDVCGAALSGNPIVKTLTDSSGSFTLQNVPVGNNIPLVIQLGKWRRQITIASVPSCVSTPVPAVMTTLPGKHGPGADMPKIAFVSGDADPLECLLLKLGIDKSEIAEPANGANARIHYFQGDHNPGGVMSGNTPKGATLYGDFNTLKQYDVVMLPCEGHLYDQSAGTGNIAQYINMGGRVFTTHWSYDWWQYQASPFNSVGSWHPDLGDHYNDPQGIQGKITTTLANGMPFQKGADFVKWLIAAAVTPASPMGFLQIIQGRHNLTKIDNNLAQDWINFDFGPNLDGPGVMHITFNTPLNPPKDSMGNPMYCGRAVYSDFHVTANALNQSGMCVQQDGTPQSQWPFPTCCNASGLSDQEKALAFMLFDLSSCVQSDQKPPIP
jgi:hypothetical protein